MFRWTEFLQVAKRLARDEMGDEGMRRTAISRAYYFAFGIACDVLRAWGVPEQKLRSHEYVWSYFLHQAQSDAINWLKARDAHDSRMKTAQVWKEIDSILSSQNESEDSCLPSVTRRVFDEGDALKTLRHRADYKTQPIAKQHVELAIARAEEVQRLLQLLDVLSESDRGSA